jgi:osmotically-inducible protein OsmY
MKLRLALLGSLALASSGALAASFNDRDLNGDGFISKDEVSAIRGYDAALAEADDNRDGRLSRDEFTKAESIYERQQVGKYIDDSVLTAKVKAALLRERGVPSADVNVETRQGRVFLSGFVDTEDQKKRALNVASRVEGVREVRDGISVR